MRPLKLAPPLAAPCGGESAASMSVQCRRSTCGSMLAVAVGTGTKAAASMAPQSGSMGELTAAAAAPPASASGRNGASHVDNESSVRRQLNMRMLVISSKMRESCVGGQRTMNRLTFHGDSVCAY